MNTRWATALALLATVSSAAAQEGGRPKASQTGTVSQEIASTKISLVYDRPVARGRDLFGSLVKWGVAWTPGANWATTIELNKDITIEGQPLNSGKYSIWAIPQEHEWTMIFSKEERVFHTKFPEGKDALRVSVKPTVGSHMETLAWYFPVVGPDSAVLAVHWGTTVVPLAIRLPK
jgi:hypothetical protein